MPEAHSIRIKQDFDLRSLHDDPRFQALVARGEARPAEESRPPLRSKTLPETKTQYDVAILGLPVAGVHALL